MLPGDAIKTIHGLIAAHSENSQQTGTIPDIEPNPLTIFTAFPNLFEEYLTPDGNLRMKFELGTEFPTRLIGLVKMVAFLGKDTIVIRQPDGWWEPGGKLEPGENYQETIRREILEEI